ncbi:hypothetical protein ABIQ69_03035 [Agromyces sp. G08B096]|uniref:Uncharacterized protein n=1 Tax=Agromyces sp. G08B096 TaxID=3156399 RepID=A0AAU7W8D9_9MICO
MPGSPRRLPRLPVLVASVLIVGGLAACSGGPAPSPAPTTAAPTESADEPIFASDEEALAAAVEAYEAYNSLASEITADPSRDAAEIARVADESTVPQFEEDIEALRAAGLRIVGNVSLSGAKLAERSEDASRATVAIYVCRDVSDTRVLDKEGNDVTKPDRASQQPQLATLVSSPSEPRQLIVKDLERWQDDNVC